MTLKRQSLKAHEKKLLLPLFHETWQETGIAIRQISIDVRCGIPKQTNVT
jgi:hypothetical protein